MTHEWSDGILAVTYRYAAQQEKIHNIPDRQWVMLDGPVDAIWIENMNTVLDDNKKLCLMSGEMIAMSAAMSMIFEVQDLAVASPATVSRCGMVYVEPSQLGWEPLLASWLETLPPPLAPHADKLKNLFGWLVPPCVRFTIKECKATVSVGIQATDEITRVRGVMSLFDSLTMDLRPKAGGGEQSDADAEALQEYCESVKKDLPLWVENIFLFSLVWSVGGALDGASRPKFDEFLRAAAAGRPPRGYDKVDGAFGEAAPWAKFMPEGAASVYDYVFEKGKKVTPPHDPPPTPQPSLPRPRLTPSRPLPHLAGVEALDRYDRQGGHQDLGRLGVHADRGADDGHGALLVPPHLPPRRLEAGALRRPHRHRQDGVRPEEIARPPRRSILVHLHQLLGADLGAHWDASLTGHRTTRARSPTALTHPLLPRQAIESGAGPAA